MLRSLLIFGAVLIAISVGGLLVATLYVSRPAFDETLVPARLAEQRIAPADQAVTFARVLTDDGMRLLLVRDLDSQDVVGVDITERFPVHYDDPLAAYHEIGHDELAALATSAAGQSFPAGMLTLPVEFAGPHIAAGTNFRAHAEEAMLDGEPFLFPKLSAPTQWNATVPVSTRLDYEAELCAITLATVREPARAPLGFLLCNDYTDRWALIRDIDLDAPMGTTGFAGAKGRSGFLPVGQLLVIPRDSESFVDQVGLELYVNGKLRQRAPSDLMVWTTETILRNALARCADSYTTPGGAMPLTSCDGIPARTLILTGTPAGVIFRPINVWYAPAYLQPDDEVVTLGTNLGWLRNRVDLD